MGSIKDRNGRDITEAMKQKRLRGSKNRQNYPKKIFMTQIIMMV